MCFLISVYVANIIGEVNEVSSVRRVPVYGYVFLFFVCFGGDNLHNAVFCDQVSIRSVISDLLRAFTVLFALRIYKNCVSQIYLEMNPTAQNTSRDSGFGSGGAFGKP